MMTFGQTRENGKYAISKLRSRAVVLGVALYGDRFFPPRQASLHLPLFNLITKPCCVELDP